MAPSNHNKGWQPGLLRGTLPPTKLFTNAWHPDTEKIIAPFAANLLGFTVVSCFSSTAFDMNFCISQPFNWHAMVNPSYTSYGILGWPLLVNLIMIPFQEHVNFSLTVVTLFISNMLKVTKTMASQLFSLMQPHSTLKQTYLPKTNWPIMWKAQWCTICPLHMVHAMWSSSTSSKIFNRFCTVILMDPLP